MAFKPLVCGVLVGVLTFGVASAAFAEPSAADKETARRLMAEARDKRAKNDPQGALQAFLAADALMHVPTTGIEVARTLATLGQLIEARDTALRVARSAPEPNEPPPFTRAREEAKQLSDSLAKRIPDVTVRVTGNDPDARPDVTVDSAKVAPAAVGLPRTVNPGHHVIVARSGKKEAKSEIDVAEGEHKDVPLELQAAPSLPSGTEPEARASADSGQTRIGKPIMIGGLVVGGVGLVVGSVAGLISVSKTSTIKDNCSGASCPSSEAVNIDSARSTATLSNIGFAFAVVGAGAGVVGYFLWKREQARGADEGSRAAGPVVRPWIGLGAAGASGVF